MVVARLGFCLCLRDVISRRSCAITLHQWRLTVTLLEGVAAVETEKLRTSQVAHMLQGARAQLASRARLPLTVEEDLSAAKAALQQEMLTSKQAHDTLRKYWPPLLLLQLPPIFQLHNRSRAMHHALNRPSH